MVMLHSCAEFASAQSAHKQQSVCAAWRGACCKDTRAGRVSAISQTKDTAIKAQWHAAHRSIQDGVAGLPGTVEVFKHPS
jgi:hypothetical protein